MVHDVGAARAEAAPRADRARQRPDDHIHEDGVYVLVLGQAAASAAEDGVGVSLFEDEAELVFELEVDLRDC